MPSPQGPGRLTERERKIARRVRQSLHLPASMSEEEVAAELYNTFAWKRERAGLAREELWAALTDAAAPAGTWIVWAGRRLKQRVQALWSRPRE